MTIGLCDETKSSAEATFEPSNEQWMIPIMAASMYRVQRSDHDRTTRVSLHS